MESPSLIRVLLVAALTSAALLSPVDARRRSSRVWREERARHRARHSAPTPYQDSSRIEAQIGSPPAGLKKRTVEGVITRIDAEKRRLTLRLKDGDEIPVDAEAGLIRGEKGAGRFEELRVGDRVKVRGEGTVQGGVRAMEITLRRERSSSRPEGE